MSKKQSNPLPDCKRPPPPMPPCRPPARFCCQCECCQYERNPPKPKPDVPKPEEPDFSQRPQYIAFSGKLKQDNNEIETIKTGVIANTFLLLLIIIILAFRDIV